MRSRKSRYGAADNTELIWQALAAELRRSYDVSQPLPANIEILLQCLVCQEIHYEANSRDDLR